MLPINSPGATTRSKASAGLREFAREFIACTETNGADAYELGISLAIACELEGVSLFKLVAEERSASKGAGS